jgi:hypothetical protein
LGKSPQGRKAARLHSPAVATNYGKLDAGAVCLETVAYNYWQGITIIPMKGQPRMLTARQYAAAREVAYTTVINWLNKKLLTDAEKEELAYGDFMWRIPEDAPVPELKPGPKPSKKTAKKGARAK